MSIDEVMTEKQCYECKQIKPTEEFYPSKYRKGGRDCRCRVCRKACQRRYYAMHREKLNEQYRKKYIMRREEYKKRWLVIKLKALQKVSGLEKPICCNCGCDDLRLLQVNHINGGGGREIRELGGMYSRILSGSRKIDDLNVLCRPCDGLYYLQKKYGEVPMEIIWKRENK